MNLSLNSWCIIQKTFGRIWWCFQAITVGEGDGAAHAKHLGFFCSRVVIIVSCGAEANWITGENPPFKSVSYFWCSTPFINCNLIVHPGSEADRTAFEFEWSTSSDGKLKANFHPFAVSQHWHQDHPRDASTLALWALSKLHCARHPCCRGLHPWRLPPDLDISPWHSDGIAVCRSAQVFHHEAPENPGLAGTTWIEPHSTLPTFFESTALTVSEAEADRLTWPRTIQLKFGISWSWYLVEIWDLDFYRFFAICVSPACGKNWNIIALYFSNWQQGWMNKQWNSKDCMTRPFWRALCWSKKQEIGETMQTCNKNSMVHVATDAHVSTQNA